MMSSAAHMHNDRLSSVLEQVQNFEELMRVSNVCGHRLIG